jgi:hypothetical protein
MSKRYKQSTYVEQMVLALAELERQHGFLMLELGWADVVILVGSIQLALRHPDNLGYTADRARKIKDDIIAIMEMDVPALGPLMRMGDDPSADWSTVGNPKPKGGK